MDLYPEIVHQGNLSPDTFAEVDGVCEQIVVATKGFGTNEVGLIRALASQSPTTRCKIAIRFKDVHDKGKELKKLIESECGKGDFGMALQLLSVSPDEADCEIIKKACKGINDDLLLYPIIVGRSNRDMEVLRKKFFAMYSKDLGQYLTSELGGDFEDLIVNCLQASEESYDSLFHTDDKAKEDAEALFKMGQGQWGTDEKGLFKLLCFIPPQHMKNIHQIYADKYGYTLVKAMEKEFAGKTRDAVIHLVNMKIRPAEAVAKLVDKACKGFGTNELLLTAVLIRYQTILKDVMEAHEELYGKNIIQRIMDETDGDYKRLLVQLCQSAQTASEEEKNDGTVEC